jgi:hypothetical protein
MKAFIRCIAVALGISSSLFAIPNTVFGPIVHADSPLNGTDLTGPVLAALEGDGQLPGEWVAEGEVGTSAISHLLARPEVFGREVVILRAVRRDGVLERVEATFADAGSFFGYYDEELPKGMGEKEARALAMERLKVRQDEFSKIYEESLDEVREEIGELADKESPKERRVGKGRTLRAEVEEWEKGDLVIRLFSADQRLVRAEISRKDLAPSGWMDRAFEDESERERKARLLDAVQKEDGVVRVAGLRPIPQGYKPYCGLNTLAMAARHFGLHLDEDWLAAAGGFQNTGSASGSNMVKLYSAVAAEAGMSMDRSPDFDELAVRRALESGRPVIVWRRFSWDRNRLHDRVARQGGELPDPLSADEKASWPGEDAPLHASILTGFDPRKREVFFLESWAGNDEPRRMRFEEMAATTYLCFIFDE